MAMLVCGRVTLPETPRGDETWRPVAPQEELAKTRAEIEKTEEDLRLGDETA